MSIVKNVRVQAVPLITHDPYFSAWSPSDNLYDTDVMHWCGAPHRMSAHAVVDGKAYRFMGATGATDTLKQVDLGITPTASCYVFEGAGITLEVDFVSPLLITDLELVSRPCTYLDFRVRSTDGNKHDVEIFLDADESFCHNAHENRPMLGGVHKLPKRDQLENCGWMGLRKQMPLSQSGDGIRIDWGYMYTYASLGGACCADSGYSQDIATWRKENIGVAFGEENTSGVFARVKFTALEKEATSFMAVAYDDLQAINYFGWTRKALWADEGESAIEMIMKAIDQHDSIIARCKVFNDQLMADATELAGEEYALLCALAYRQSIAAHKLIRDEEGNVIFLSKENFSNGCIGTVDVSYPSTPLYLLYNPELVKGMIRPVTKFANLPVWKYDFAPHDVGRYPYATGQVYALRDYQGIDNGDVFPPYYIYPDTSDVYDLRHQMPVEECGNMLVMIAAVLQQDPTYIYEISEDMPLLEQWGAYLIKHGDDPGEQLCTDDFAGHLAHNVNLSGKAIMGVAALGIIKEAAGEEAEGKAYLQKAKAMAKTWEGKFEGRTHTPLTFDKPETWGQKYNLAWDLVFGTGLFEPETYAREVKTYLKKSNKYGLPLDSRKDYTKSDWILWCASFANEYKDRHALIAPVCEYVKNSPDRVPFSDWYCTKESTTPNFRNRTVQGGIFMPMLRAKSEE